MSRYSPTVVAEAGPSLGDALVGALHEGLGVYQMRKDNRRADARDQREQEMQTAQLRMLAQQTERARYENEVAPIKDQADLRRSGIVKLPPGVIGINGSVPLPGGGSVPIVTPGNPDPSRYTAIGQGYAVD